MSISAEALPNAPLAAAQHDASMHIYSCRSLHAEKEAKMGILATDAISSTSWGLAPLSSS